MLGTLEQVGLAIKLDARYSKAQILGMYLDSVYFGDGHWGIVQASQGYFGKPPARLSFGEASLLAGLVQAPSVYDPRVAPRRRRAPPAARARPAGRRRDAASGPGGCRQPGPCRRGGQARVHLDAGLSA